MIAATHTLIYADDAEATRAFFRDVLGWPNVEDVDSEPGWLIFALPPGELGVHPADEGRPSGTHALFLMCHDIEATMLELETKGAEFTMPVTDAGFGLITQIKIPGGGEIGLYEPRHKSPLGEFATDE